MNIAIFGGGGFLGQYLIDALLENSDYFLQVFDRGFPELVENSGISRLVNISGDFGDIKQVCKVLEGVDIAFHLISTTLPATSNNNPSIDIQENLVPTIKFLEAAHKCGVRKVIFFSSGGTIYGDSNILPISESHPTNPICSYGIQKLAIEKYLHLFYKLYGLDYGILRIGNPFGSHQDIKKNQGFIQTAVCKALAGRPIEVWGDGTIVRDYLHAQDVATAAKSLISYQGSYKIFNIGSGIGHSINQVLLLIAEHLGGELVIEYAPSRVFDLRSNILEISLAKSELGWSPKVRLESYLLEQLKSS